MGRDLSAGSWAALGPRGGVEKGDLLVQRTQNYWLFKAEPNLRHSLIFTTKPHIQEIRFAVAKCRKLILTRASPILRQLKEVHVVTFLLNIPIFVLKYLIV